MQTDENIKVKKWSDVFVANNHIDVAKASGFEVRIVDNLNAYDWLSQKSIDFIKQAHLRSIVQMPVFELLRLALLYEHGGVALRLPHIIMIDSISWAQDLIEARNTSRIEKALSCNLPQPQVVLFHRHKEDWSL